MYKFWITTLCCVITGVLFCSFRLFDMRRMRQLSAKKFEYNAGNPTISEVVAILDMSGSMQHLTNDTIGGFNSYLDELRKTDLNLKISLITFNNWNHNIWNHKPISNCKNIDKSVYRPRGGTALVDALGRRIIEMH